MWADDDDDDDGEDAAAGGGQGLTGVNVIVE
jgi:hypothetical protein